MTEAARNAVRIMRGSYGNKWKGDDDVWMDGLKAFDRSTLAFATNSARQDYEDWPPTLMQFRGYCLRHRDASNDSKQEDFTAYNKWAEKEGLQTRLPGEDLETMRRRLVVQYDQRHRNLYGNEYWQFIAENREANKRMQRGVDS